MRWVSGLNQQFAKLSYGYRTGGSNPPLTAERGCNSLKIGNLQPLSFLSSQKSSHFSPLSHLRITRKTLWKEKIIHSARQWRTLSPLYFTPRHISFATLLESVRNGNKICIPVPLRAQKEEKTSFLARSGNKSTYFTPLRHLRSPSQHSSWRS